jgi:lysozyme
VSPKALDIFHGDTITSFADVYGAGIRGVIHKATEGATFTDNAYASRRPEALAAGLRWGAYHFMRPGDMAGQAHFFLATARPTAATRVCADYEDGRLGLADLMAFCTEIEAHFKQLTTIYSYLDMLLEQIADATPEQLAFLAARPLWLADFNATPPTCPAPWKSWSLLQYTQSGSLAGTRGAVDLNSFDGTDADLAAQWSGT